MKDRRVRADVVSYNSVLRGHPTWQSTLKALDELTLELHRLVVSDVSAFLIFQGYYPKSKHLLMCGL